MARPFGLLATFDTPADVARAAAQTRREGYRQWDVISPIPIHGIDPAMGLRRSLVPRFSIVGGATGLIGGMLMIWWMSAVDYALVVGAKPLFSPHFAFPVSYELTILLSAFATIIGMLVLNRLPRHHHPVLKRKDVAKAMDDTFFLYIETEDPQFDPVRTRAFLESLQPKEISELED